MDFVPYKRQLARVNLEKEISSVLEERVKALPNYIELRLNPEIILLACNLIENSVGKKDKIQKKEIVVKILSGIFNYSPADKKGVEDTVEFLHANKRIKRVKLIKKVLLFVGEWIKRKWL
jgi:hypothetical protein